MKNKPSYKCLLDSVHHSNLVGTHIYAMIRVSNLRCNLSCVSLLGAMGRWATVAGMYCSVLLSSGYYSMTTVTHLGLWVLTSI
jgi:hypothetical protein